MKYFRSFENHLKEEMEITGDPVAKRTYIVQHDMEFFDWIVPSEKIHVKKGDTILVNVAYHVFLGVTINGKGYNTVSREDFAETQISEEEYAKSRGKRASKKFGFDK